jgi:hypothetical protein
MPDEENEQEMPQGFPAGFPMLFMRQPSKEEHQKHMEGKFDAGKSYLQPFWRDVNHKDDAATHFIKMGMEDAKHLATCTCAECGFCGGSRARFCTPDTFVHAVISRVERFGEVPEAAAFMEFWKDRGAPDVALDPRYLLYKTAWDQMLVIIAISRRTMQDVFDNEGMDVG